MHNAMPENERVTVKSNSEFTRSRISQLTSFISWTYYQQDENNKQEQLYVMQCFTEDNIARYIDFQFDQLGKDELAQASYFRNMIDCFKFVCNKLVHWIPSLDISQGDRDYFIHTNARTLQYVEEHVTNVNFKEKIWTNLSKRANYLADNGLTLSKEDIKTVEKYCSDIVCMLHKMWLRLEEKQEEREILWNSRGYHVMESHCWVTLIHMWLFGIRPSSLLQVRKDNFVVESAGFFKFAIVFHFNGNDKSQYGGIGRKLGFSKLTEQFLYYVHERLPVAHTFYNRDPDCSVLFLSSHGLTLSKDSLTSVIKRMYGRAINKYTTPRLVRFWLGHYGYEAAKGNEE